MAARVHDSVLQTLASSSATRTTPAASRRWHAGRSELRGWLYGDRPLGDDGRRSSPRCRRPLPTSRTLRRPRRARELGRRGRRDRALSSPPARR